MAAPPRPQLPRPADLRGPPPRKLRRVFRPASREEERRGTRAAPPRGRRRRPGTRRHRGLPVVREEGGRRRSLAQRRGRRPAQLPNRRSEERVRSVLWPVGEKGVWVDKKIYLVGPTLVSWYIEEI